MAQRFVDAATQQLAPVYDQQATAIQSQVPAIQNLYNTLVQGLQTQYDTQLNTGVQQITEDASARGVLRSTLPVDARQALTTQLGQALMTSRGELAAKQAGDIANVNEKLGTLGIQRASNIADLARALESQDLEQQKFQFAKTESDRDYALQQQQLADKRAASVRSNARASASDTVSPDTAAASILLQYRGADQKVSPQVFRIARQAYIEAGGNNKTFMDRYWNFANQAHWWDYYYGA